MCGIAGILALDGGLACADADAELIERMTRALATAAGRAPHDRRRADRLGHRRLSVIDPSPDADQPMRSADARTGSSSTARSTTTTSSAGA